MTKSVWRIIKQYKIPCFYCFWLNNFWDSINHFFKWISVVFIIYSSHFNFYDYSIIFQDVGLSQLLHQTVKRQGNSKLYMIIPGCVREHQTNHDIKLLYLALGKLEHFISRYFKKIASSFLPWRYFDLLHRVMVMNI